jgi:ATP-binding protein involved in chromosome partitioning
MLGIVENMSYFLYPHCGGRSEILSRGGRATKPNGTEFLGEVPLDLKIRETSDAGTPITVAEPDNRHAPVFRHMAAPCGKKSLARAPCAPAAHRHRIGVAVAARVFGIAQLGMPVTSV